MNLEDKINPINQKALRKARIDQLIDSGKALFNEHNAGKFTDFNNYLKKCCFFVTMTFDQHKLNALKSYFGLKATDDTIEFDMAYRFYKWAVETMSGGHVTTTTNAKLQSQLPPVWIASDFEGSRFASDLTNAGRNVHLHAIWFLHPGNSDRIQQVIDEVNTSNSLKPDFWMDAIEFAIFDRKKGTLKNLAGYTLKAEHKKSTEDLPVSYQRYPQDLKIRQKPEFAYLSKIPMGTSPQAKMLLDGIESDRRSGRFGGFKY